MIESSLSYFKRIRKVLIANVIFIVLNLLLSLFYSYISMEGILIVVLNCLWFLGFIVFMVYYLKKMKSWLKYILCIPSLAVIVMIWFYSMYIQILIYQTVHFNLRAGKLNTLVEEIKASGINKLTKSFDYATWIKSRPSEDTTNFVKKEDFDRVNILLWRAFVREYRTDEDGTIFIAFPQLLIVDTGYAYCEKDTIKVSSPYGELTAWKKLECNWYKWEHDEEALSDIK